MSTFLKSSSKSEVYSEPCQTTQMEHFAKNCQRLKVVNYFCKTLRLRCLTGFWIRHFKYLLWKRNDFRDVSVDFYNNLRCRCVQWSWQRLWILEIYRGMPASVWNCYNFSNLTYEKYEIIMKSKYIYELTCSRSYKVSSNERNYLQILSTSFYGQMVSRVCRQKIFSLFWSLTRNLIDKLWALRL